MTYNKVDLVDKILDIGFGGVKYFLDKAPIDDDKKTRLLFNCVIIAGGPLLVGVASLDALVVLLGGKGL